MDSQSKSGSCTDDTVIRGADGHSYKRLSLQEAKDLCRDVQFYKTSSSPSIEMIRSAFQPADYRGYMDLGMGRLRLWYLGDCYYILIDIDKPEYEPV